jgi:UDPglucose 6-dehydrogenase
VHITVFGTGYVELIAGARFAEIGNQVVCLDVGRRRIDWLNRGLVPIFEPGLEGVVELNSRGDRLTLGVNAS